MGHDISQTTEADAQPTSPPVGHAHSSRGGNADSVVARGDSGLAYRVSRGPGLAIVAPLSFGVTLAGIEHAHGQRQFLEAMASGSFLVTYDQRGAGASAQAGAPSNWQERADDLWRVADEAGIERAVLYGVADAGYTAIHAALASPERVLALIFNFVPLSFAAPSPARGVSEDRARQWFRPSEAGKPSSARAMMDDFGIAEADAIELVRDWDATTSAANIDEVQRLIIGADVGPLLSRLAQPTLVIEPARHPFFQGWGDSLAELLPNARVSRPTRGIQALGTIHGFLSMLTLDLGRHASQLSPSLSRVLLGGERAMKDVRRIAVAVDDDMISARAVELACRLGEAQRAEIALIHVVQVPYTLPLDQPPRERMRQGERALSLGAAIVERHGLPPVKRRLVPGRSIAGSILSATEELHADLIVLANRGKSDRTAAGSEVIEELVRRAPGKVIIDRAGS